MVSLDGCEAAKIGSQGVCTSPTLPSPPTPQHAVPTGSTEGDMGWGLSPGLLSEPGATAKAFICCQKNRQSKLSGEFSGGRVFVCCPTIS